MSSLCHNQDLTALSGPLDGITVSGGDAKQHSASSPKPKDPRPASEGYFGRASPPGESSTDNHSRSLPGIQEVKNTGSSKPRTISMEELPAYDDVVAVAVDVAGAVEAGSSSRRGSAAASRLPISPRLEEGRETLPDYSCTITGQAVFHRKMEYESAVHKARDRNWYKVFVELQGTALRIHKLRNTGAFAKNNVTGLDTEAPVRAEQTTATASADLPLWYGKGELVRSYTLQHGDVGVASDYQKRRYVIRLRIETDQFLLSCLELPTFVAWLELLSAAIDLSHPLESRSLPREYPLPRRGRRRPDNTTSNNNNNPDRNDARNDVRLMLRDNDLVLQQREIMRTQFPHLVEEGPSPRQAFLRNRALSTATTASTSSNIDTANQRSQSRSDDASQLGLSRTSSASSTTASLASPSPFPSPSPSSSQHDLHPSISAETGKWSPEQTWTRQFDLLYAKRCMAVLRKKSPRKSDVVIIRGQEWQVNWGTGRVVKVGLPGYGEDRSHQRSSRALSRGCVITLP